MSGSAAGGPGHNGDASKLKGQEIEIKFRADAGGLALLLDSPLLKNARELQTEALKATYFDTPSHALRKKGIILRIRKSGNDVPVLGMKGPGAVGDGPFHRKEVEVISPGQKPDLALFDKITRKFLARTIGEQPLAAKFNMEFTRLSGLVTSGSSAVEIAVDQGHISAGKQRMPLAEVELELVSGCKSDLLDLAAGLAKDFSLRLDFVSKAEKGFRTLLAEKPIPVKAAPLKAKSLTSFDDAVAAILSSTLAQFVANWAVLRESDEPESIHQMRIALRRMRCGLAIFNRAAPGAGFGELRNDAGRLASAFGPARNTDAVRMSLLNGPLASMDCAENSEALRALLERRRVAAYADARSVLGGIAPTAFVLKVQNVLARRDWRGVPASGNSKKPQVSARKLFKAELNRLRARVLKREKSAAVSDEARHKLRIALKNLRYGVEFFGDLFGKDKRRRAFRKRMSALQDHLGLRNDIVIARIYLKELSDEMGLEAERMMEFIRGWHAREVCGVDRAISKSWKKFKREKIFWK
jgi:triphosphatase